MNKIPASLLPLLAGLAFGLVAPVLATSIRALRARETRKARKTPGTADDDFWAVAGPAMDRIADLIDRGDIDGARRAVRDLRESGR